MPRYRFVIHGRGEFPDDMCGFFTTRWCIAESQEQAGKLALQAVRADWLSGEWGIHALESLDISEGWPIGLLGFWRRVPNKGYTFYGGSESEVEARSIELEAAFAPKHLQI